MARASRSAVLSNGITLPYVEQGEPSGLPVVLLHALLDSWRSYELVLPHLPPSIHALVPTQRGHRDATAPDTGFSMPDFAGDVVAFLDAVGLESVVLVGHSSHALVSQRVALEDANRVSALVLLGAPADLRQKPALRELWTTTISHLTDPVPVDFVREFQEGAFVRPLPPTFVESLVQDALTVPARVWREAFHSLFEDDLPGRRADIVAPSLIVWGDADQIAPRSDQDALLGVLPDSQLAVYAGTGHAPHWEEPDRFAQDLTAFVHRVLPVG